MGGVLFLDNSPSNFDIEFVHIQLEFVHGNTNLQDMMVLLSRAVTLAGISHASGSADDLDAFADRAGVADYAVNHVAALMKGGIVEGSGSMLNPAGHATRAEAAVLLYRMYSK